MPNIDEPNDSNETAAEPIWTFTDPAGIRRDSELIQYTKTFALDQSNSDANLVEVHAVVNPGPPSFTVSGTPTSPPPETRDRVLAAITNSGLALPPGQITVHLTSPQPLTTFAGADLAIAVAVLTAATSVRPAPAAAARVVYVGELALDGGIRPVRSHADPADLVISELPPGSPPTRRRFLARNRLIAALAAAVVVVEASTRSGALTTATQATTLGKPLAAVPGPITSATSAGCHQLLRTGAICVTSAAEIDELITPQQLP